MKLFNNEDIVIANDKACCTAEDAEDARSVAFRLNMPFHVFNFTDDFDEQVIRRFVQSYQNGATPNPCIDCNRYMKFEKLFARAMLMETDCVVTGHYARVEYDLPANRYLLKKAIDEDKDQSYVLYFMTQEQLRHTVFPLGGLYKHEVRELALQQGFLNAKKSDSQDICFVQNNDYAGFIEQYTGMTFEDGNFVDENGKVLGTHKGIIRYTIGQRKGLGLALPAPLYVCSKDIETNTVTLCDNDGLYSKTLTATDFNFISLEKLDKPTRIKAKIRYNQKEQWATAEQVDDKTVRVEFDEPQRAIAKGQAVVLYDGDIVVGGGAII
jgi:tRNA-specific 2-thiouridylase